jgi:hypothetical protein
MHRPRSQSSCKSRHRGQRHGSHSCSLDHTTPRSRNRRGRSCTDQQGGHCTSSGSLRPSSRRRPCRSCTVEPVACRTSKWLAGLSWGEAIGLAGVDRKWERFRVPWSGRVVIEDDSLPLMVVTRRMAVGREEEERGSSRRGLRCRLTTDALSALAAAGGGLGRHCCGCCGCRFQTAVGKVRVEVRQTLLHA